MERRTFMLGLFALSAGGSVAALTGKAEAASVTTITDALAKDESVSLPDDLPVELAQYRRRRRRRVCTFRRNRFGRRVRVCRTVWY